MAVVMIGLAPLGGCRICADCEDLAYPAYGGAWQRTQRDSGRVGSIFDPAGGKSPTLADRDQPPTPEELERRRQEERGGGFGAPDREFDSDSTESNSDPSPPADATKDLLERMLEDIGNEKEDALRQKSLDDIEIHVIPRDDVPAQLR